MIRPVAVIDIGTTSIRMAIAEIDDNGGVRTLETLSQAVTLGKDAFTKGYIDKVTIEDCVRVLRSYCQKLEEYSISQPDQIRVVATSAVREADNRLAFLDRIYIATGIQVEPIDEAEVSRVAYHGIQPFLMAEPELASARTLVMEVGGGSTELLLIRNGNVAYSHTFRLGSLRLRKSLEDIHGPTGKVREMMSRQIGRMVGEIREHVPANGNVHLIAMGGDVRFAVANIDPDWDRVGLAKIPIGALEIFAESILKQSVDELVRKYHLSFPNAETVGPALLTYLELALTFELQNILVSNTNLRDGLLNEMALREAWTDDFRKQIIRSAVALGQKFSFDEKHARHVAELSHELFRQLADDHKLEPRYELILYVAALLHEIGLFISNTAYHKHSQYLIRNSELFGLAKNDLLLISLVARYHRRASPQSRHEGYVTLDRDHRVAVSKMAAILRLAASLDESRSQRINQLQCKRRSGQLVVSVSQVEDLSLEQLALRQSGSLFEEVFGLNVMLRNAR